jgi:hypothetical protein
MKKLILLPVLSLILSGCGQTQTPEVNNDSLNLFNDKPPVTVEGGTESDPLDLFTDEEEKIIKMNNNFFSARLPIFCSGESRCRCLSRPPLKI